jgi:hypothetical protein
MLFPRKMNLHKKGLTETAMKKNDEFGGKEQRKGPKLGEETCQAGEKIMSRDFWGGR